MSEQRVVIGGDLPKKHLKEFIDYLKMDHVDFITSSLTKFTKKSKTSLIIENSVTYYEVFNFCHKHNLSYMDLYTDDDGTSIWMYWLPNMKEPKEIHVVGGQLPAVTVEDIQPISKLILECLNPDHPGLSALPPLITDKSLAPIIEEVLKNPNQLYQILKREMNKKFPPRQEDIPPFRII